MNDTILIILLVLMAATFVKVVVGAMRSKKTEKGKQESLVYCSTDCQILSRKIPLSQFVSTCPATFRKFLYFQ